MESLAKNSGDKEQPQKGTGQRDNQPQPATTFRSPRRVWSNWGRRRRTVNRRHIIVHSCEKLSHGKGSGKYPSREPRGLRGVSDKIESGGDGSSQWTNTVPHQR